MVPRIRCADVGAWARTRAVAATEAVVASEIARLRRKERENKTIVTSEQDQPLRAWTFPRPNLLRFPDIFLEGSPKENSRQSTIGREPLKHGVAVQCSQLKTNLGF